MGSGNMKYYERLINDTCDRPLLPAMAADSRITELEAELAVAYHMVSVLKAVIAEKDLVIRVAAAWGKI
jgi:hypothetical protein